MSTDKSMSKTVSLVVLQLQMEKSSYFAASRHKPSAFFSIIFCFPFCYYPLLASAVFEIIVQDQRNRLVVGKDENTGRQLINMISSDNCHVVEQACSALSTLDGDVYVTLQLMKRDIMLPIETVLKSPAPEQPVSVLQVVINLTFASNTVTQEVLTKGVARSLQILCAHKNPKV